MIFTITNFLLLCIVAVFFIIARIIVYIKTKNKDLKKEFFYFVLCLYATSVIIVTLLPIARSVGILSFSELKVFINFDLFDTFKRPMSVGLIVNVLGNVCLLIPLIPLLGLSFPNKVFKFKKALLISLVTTVMIEFLQLVESYLGLSVYFARVADINDILYNLIGGIIGYILYYIYKRNSVKD